MHAPEQQNIAMPRPSATEQSVVCAVYVAEAVMAGEGGDGLGLQSRHTTLTAKSSPLLQIVTPYLAPRYKPKMVVQGPNSSNRKPIPPPMVSPTSVPTAPHKAVIAALPTSSFQIGFSQYAFTAAHSADSCRLSSSFLFRFLEFGVGPDPTTSSAQKSIKYWKVPSSLRISVSPFVSDMAMEEGLDKSKKSGSPPLLWNMNCEFGYCWYTKPSFAAENASSLCPIKEPVGVEGGHDSGDTMAYPDVVGTVTVVEVEVEVEVEVDVEVEVEVVVVEVVEVEDLVEVEVVKRILEGIGVT
jgi:hypothetical protein